MSKYKSRQLDRLQAFELKKDKWTGKQPDRQQKKHTDRYTELRNHSIDLQIVYERFSLPFALILAVSKYFCIR